MTDIIILKSLNEAERGYLAGIIDGEGCITFSMSRNGSGTLRTVPRLRVSIENTSDALRCWLMKKLPHVGRVYRHDCSKLSRKNCYSWRLRSAALTVQFLREIEPYLVIKKSQAFLLSHGYGHLTRAEQTSLAHAVQSLNGGVGAKYVI